MKKTSAKVMQTGESVGQLAWKKLRRHRAGSIGMIIVGLLTLIAITADIISPFNPVSQVLEYSLKPAMFRGNALHVKNPSNPELPIVIPIKEFHQQGDSVFYVDFSGRADAQPLIAMHGTSAQEFHSRPLYILGTDAFGRDLLSRVLHGARISLVVGVLSQALALLIGIVLGATAGYFRGKTDGIIMWVCNVVWAFPTILLAILFSIALKTANDAFGFSLDAFWQTFIAIGISSWVDIARVVRGQFFSLREMEYVEATRALGYGATRTIFRHILPNALGPIIVLSTAGIASAVIIEASFSFVGLGIQKPQPSWGILIFDGYGYISNPDNWGLAVFPSIAIALAVYGFNLLGDGLNDAFDPKSLRR
ncbi:MAG: ABC transporter permease [Bacteroidetes bacterium]|nr:ABC transporter permease [Bacteroidota bacterium]MCZ2133411.1 ABC transporter permease [Bacteroidota bacterium]